MIVDTSALIAILMDEAEAERFVDAVVAARGATMSAASYLETSIVVDRAGDAVRSRRLDDLIRTLGIEIADVTEEQAQVARAAYRDFGRGVGHPARLNFGDCFSYALSTVRDEPLLYKGDDFGHTDIRSAI